MFYVTPLSVGEQSIVISVSVCSFVCPSVSTSAYFRNHTSTVHSPIFVHSELWQVWPWLDPLPSALRYVIYFLFMDDVMCISEW